MTNAPPDNPQSPETFRANTVAELLQATLTPTKVITSWGMRKPLEPGILAGIQNTPQGENTPPLPTTPDKSLINTMVPVTYPSQAGRRT